MKVGEVYTSPWGDYVVMTADPVVLRKGGGVIIGPSAQTVACMELTDRRIEAALVGLVVHEIEPAQDQTFDFGDVTNQRTLGAFRSTMSMSWATGDAPMVWLPCLSRSQVGEHVNQTHVYFMTELDGSSYCPDCRASKPRVLYLRDGVVIHDSHHDVPSAGPLNGFRSPSSMEPGLEFSRPDFSPDDDRPPSEGAGAESSAPDLLAMAVARDADVPPAVLIAKVSPLPPREDTRPLSPADDVKASTGNFDQVQRATPIGRPWLGLWEWKEWCAERAAIIEYDANQTRKIAEASARVMAGAAPR